MVGQPWATVRVEIARPGDAAQAEAWAMALEGVAAMVAEHADVGGVELRDATTLGDATRAELWVYTVPSALDDVVAKVQGVAQMFSIPVRLTSRQREDDDWRDAWKRFYRPRVFGTPPNELLLRPSWVERQSDDPKREIVLDPGHAFGTGLHESTRLCLQRLCAVTPEIASASRILDLGCGSGILSVAAAMLVPQTSIVAVDIDPDATATTTDNAARNGVGPRITVQTGDVTVVAPEPFDVVLANIRPVVLIPLAAQIGPWVRPKTRIIVSGIYGDEVDNVRAAWAANGTREIACAVEGDWSMLDLEVTA